MVKIPAHIMLPKKSYGYEHMFQSKFKDKMLKALYNAELKETCRFFMPKEPKQKRDFETVLDQELAPDRHKFKTIYSNNFEMIENIKRADKCKKQQHK